MTIITPRSYTKDFKWSLLPSNKIDTVTLTPLVNSTPDENKTFHTESFADCVVAGSSKVLPISNDVAPTHWRYMSNTYWAAFVTMDYAKARMECVWAKGKRTITVEQAVTGTPSVELQLVGTSSVINRGGSTFDNYPSIDSLSTKTYSLATWIENNKTETHDSLSGIYENGTVSMNPWIRKVVPANLIINGASIKNPTTANDIITTWYDSDASKASAQRDKWIDESSFGQDVATFDMFPLDIYLGERGEHLAACLRMRDLKLSMRCEIRKISDYVFEVEWEAPVRLAYAAASRSKGLFGGKYEVDNYAFVDNITSVNINLQGKPFDDSTVEVKYGLDSSGQLTSATSDLHPIKIQESEAFTLQSFNQDAVGANIFTGSAAAERRPGYFWIDKGTLYTSESIVNAGYVAINSLIPVEPGKYYSIPKFCGALTFYNAEGVSGEIQYFGYRTPLMFRVPSGKRLMGITFMQTENVSDVTAVNEYIPWTQTLSEQLLHKYKLGKYVVECTVPAAWAITKKLRNKSQVQFVLPSGEYIKRNGTPATFEVKNIKKVFRDSTFAFTLKLMEV